MKRRFFFAAFGLFLLTFLLTGCGGAASTEEVTSSDKNTRNVDNYYAVEAGGFVFQVPDYFEQSEDDEAEYQVDGYDATFYLYPQPEDTDFESYYKTYFDNISLDPEDGSYTVTDTSATDYYESTNGFRVAKMSCKVNYESGSIANEYNYVINDSGKNTVVLAFSQYNNSEYDYTEEIENMVLNVEAVSESQKTQNTEAENNKDKTSALYNDGHINGTLDEIMESYTTNYYNFATRVVDSLAIGRVDLVVKENSYGGQLTCSGTNNKLTIMFTGTDSSGDNETQAYEVPGKIVVLCDEASEGGDIACVCVAFGNLLCTLNPDVDQAEAADAVVTALDSGASSIGGITIKAAVYGGYYMMTVQ